MIRLYQHGVRAAKSLQHLVRDHSHIGRMSVHPVALDAVANALIRIMRRVERRYAQRPYLELAAHGNNMYRALHLRQCAAEAARHCMRCENGYIMVFQQHFQPRNMIGVLMGNKHSADITHRKLRLRQTAGDSAHGNSGVNEYIRAAALEQQAIAAGTAGKNTDLHQQTEIIFSAPSLSSGKSTISMSAPSALSFPTKFS